MDASSNEPFQRFQSLYAEAKAALPQDFNAMTVASTDAQGRPSARVCLLKDADERGFVFYTNRRSKKGRDLSRPGAWAALCFYWPVLGQQVRVEGEVALVSDEESDAYFATRPRESQLGAWVSEQSEPLASRDHLDARLLEVTKRYQGGAVPRPPHWGGFRVVPSRLEFWKAHPHRLHWREEYVRVGRTWERRTLWP